MVYSRSQPFCALDVFMLYTIPFRNWQPNENKSWKREEKKRIWKKLFPNPIIREFHFTALHYVLPSYVHHHVMYMNWSWNGTTGIFEFIDLKMTYTRHTHTHIFPFWMGIRNNKEYLYITKFSKFQLISSFLSLLKRNCPCTVVVVRNINSMINIYSMLSCFREMGYIMLCWPIFARRKVIKKKRKKRKIPESKWEKLYVSCVNHICESKKRWKLQYNLSHTDQHFNILRQFYC